MAGSYPDVPSRRMAWDADGTVLLWVRDNGPGAELSSVKAVELNDEDGNDVDITSEDFLGYLIHIFPELREFDGYFIAKATTGDGGFGELESSPDTTNGIDGAWTQESANIPDPTAVRPNYRTGITSFAATNIRGVRVRKNSVSGFNDRRMQAVHIYGEISAGETPDRLLFIDEATGLEFTLPRDYGDTPRGSSEDIEWRIKNNSTTLTATTIQYTTEALFLGADAWFTHTLPGGSTFQATQSVGSLAAATTSGLVTTRRIVSGSAVPDHYAARTYLDTGTWV
jgi:hypothetical protein